VTNDRRPDLAYWAAAALVREAGDRAIAAVLALPHPRTQEAVAQAMRDAIAGPRDRLVRVLVASGAVH
jgi:hypothetical protein